MLTADHLTTLRSRLVPATLCPHLLASCVPVAVRSRVCSGVVWAVGSDLGTDALVTIGLVPRGEYGRVIRVPIADLDIVLDDAVGRAHVARLLAAGLDGVPPAPAWHLLPPGESATPLPPEWAPHAPALLACHVARVAAGLGGLVGCALDNPYLTLSACARGALRMALRIRSRDEALAAGFALLNPDGPVLPWPGLGGAP